MNSKDIDNISPCVIVQHMFGSAGCRNSAGCLWCRFARFRDDYTRVKEWIHNAQAILGCLLTYGDENDSQIAVNNPELYDIITKARVIERSGTQAKKMRCDSCGFEPDFPWTSLQCPRHYDPNGGCEGHMIEVNQ